MTDSHENHEKTEILVVEDSATQAEFLKYLLERYDYHVTVATNGEAALRLLQSRKPSLVISDVVMPEMDGYSLCKKIKRNLDLSDIPVILVTSLNGLQDVIKGLQCGADSFIRKPYDERYLLSRVRYILANRELRKSQGFQLGVEISIGGETYFITSERQQILDLLISTYEQALHLNEELVEKQFELSVSYHWLDGLYGVAEELNRYNTEENLARNALSEILKLPGIVHGWVELFNQEVGFKVISLEEREGSQNTIPISSDFTNFCREKLRSGGLKEMVQIKEDREGNRQNVAVPLKIDDKGAAGILFLLSQQNTPLSEADIRNLESVGNQIAVALGRAQLYREMEDRVNERTAALAQEIEEHKKAEEKISFLYREATKALHARDEFLLLAAHELKTPLTPVIVLLQSLKRILDKQEIRSVSPEKLEKICNSSLEQLGQIATLIEGMLNISHISSVYQLKKENLDLSKLVRDLVNRFAEDLKAAKCPVQINAPQSVMGNWDKLQLEQVVSNLIRNAIKFGPGQPIVLTVEIEGNQGRFIIQDAGIGIAGADHQRIFDRFERAVSVDRYGGLGVGLYVAREIVRAHGGSIQVESSLTHGAKFTVHLPLNAEESHQVSAA